MKLGIIGAMRVEVESLRDSMESLAVKEKAGMVFYEGLLEGLPSVVVECGVGKVNAAMCVQVLCDLFEVSHILNTGVAGSLSADLDIGDLVISRDAMYHDFDCHILNPAYPVGQVPGLSVHRFPADDYMVQTAFDAAQTVHKDHVHIGTVASGDQFVSQKELKKQIIANTGALCTEMEGAAIAHAAWKNGKPFAVIRAISDKADDSAQMDYPTFEAKAAKHCAAVTKTVAAKMAGK